MGTKSQIIKNKMKSMKSENNNKFSSKVVILNKDVNLEMIHIPGGTFMMGSSKDELEFKSESPKHQVTLAPFWIGKYPVTQAQYQAIMGDNPSYFKGDNRPVERVNWFDAMEFCDRLSQKLGQLYTLPSEAQWEYACRAGTTTSSYFGESITRDLANHDGKQTTEVGSFPPNGFGLCDMHGNVWEWCQDYWHDDYNGAPADGSAWVDGSACDNAHRCLRGGSWYNSFMCCRSAYRNHNYPNCSLSYIGFRVVSVA